MGKESNPVDELAGHNLLIALGVERSDRNVEIATQHMRLHREGAQTFHLEQTQASLWHRLEDAYLQHSRLQEGDRAEGYFAAEQEVMNWFDEQGDDVEGAHPASKGRILRTMVRQKKRETAIVTKRRG